MGETLIAISKYNTDTLDPPHTYVPWVVVDKKPIHLTFNNISAIVCDEWSRLNDAVSLSPTTSPLSLPWSPVLILHSPTRRALRRSAANFLRPQRRWRRPVCATCDEVRRMPCSRETINGVRQHFNGLRSAKVRSEKEREHKKALLHLLRPPSWRLPLSPPLHRAAQMDTPSGGSKVDPTSLSFLWAAA